MKHTTLLAVAASVAMLGAGCNANTQTSADATITPPAQNQQPGANDTMPPMTDGTNTDQTQVDAAAQSAAAAAAAANTPAGDVKVDVDAKAKVTANPETYQLEIKNFAFTQPKQTVVRGDIVVFTNRDETRHTATADEGAFDSGLIEQDGKFTLDTSVLKPGTYTYHCTTHPNMKGVLIVEAAK